MKTMITGTVEGIISLTMDYAIENGIMAFQGVTRVTADEALGQQFLILFPSSLGFPLEVDVSIVPHMDSDGTTESFSLLLRDLSQQRVGELKKTEVRAQCEPIVQTLMPTGVYAEFQRRSTAFSSASATVLSVEFMGFIETVRSYSP
jgi:hypothetical protein